MAQTTQWGVARVVDEQVATRMPLTVLPASKEAVRVIAARERQLSGYTVDYRAAQFGEDGMWTWLDGKAEDPTDLVGRLAASLRELTEHQFFLGLTDADDARVLLKEYDAAQQVPHVNQYDQGATGQDRMTAGAGTMVAAHSLTVLADAVAVDGEAYAWLEPGQRQQGYRPRITIVTPDASIRLVRQCGPVSRKVAEARSGQAVDVLVARVLSLLGADGYTVERGEEDRG